MASGKVATGGHDDLAVRRPGCHGGLRKEQKGLATACTPPIA